MRTLLLLAVAALAAPAPVLFAQAAPQQPVPHPVTVSATAAKPEDVASIDAIIKALYDVISGPVGARRDWDRLRSLFIPGGRLIPTGIRPNGGTGMRLLDVNDYIAVTAPSRSGSASASERSHAAWTSTATSRTSSAPTKAAARPTRLPRAASTASSSCTTAPAGGSSPSTGPPRPPRAPSRGNTSRSNIS